MFQKTHILKNYILILFITLALKSVSQESKTVSIGGKIANAAYIKLNITKVLPEKYLNIDSCLLDSQGNFLIKFPISEIGIYELKLHNLSPIMLILSPDDKIIVRGDANKLIESYTITGSAISSLYADYAKTTLTNFQAIDSLSKIYRENKTNPDFVTMKPRLDSLSIQIYASQQKTAVDFAFSNANSIASLLVVNSRFGNSPLINIKHHTGLLHHIDSTLNKLFPNNIYVIDFHQRINNYYTNSTHINDHIKIGSNAPEIILPDLHGNLKKLSMYKDKLTLLFFWDSEDEASRKINQILLNLYTQLHPQGVEIYAVSLDKDKQAWENAINTDKTFWTQTIETNTANSKYLKEYNINAIPQLFLIDKQGKILLINPSPQELKTHLATHL